MRPVLGSAFRPALGLIGVVLLIALIGLSIKLLPTHSSPGRPPASSTDIPSAHSALVGSFVWQMDSTYGYRMLVPSGWEAMDGTDRRLYLPPGSAGQPDRVVLTALNLKVVAERNTSPTGTIAQWALFEQDPTLEGWTEGVERLWTSIGMRYRLEQALPQAKIYQLTPSGQAGQTVLSGYVLDQGQPLVLGLEMYGAYAEEGYLRSSGLREDFTTMVASLDAVSTNLDHPTPTSTPQPFEVLDYTVQTGDSVFSIADQFHLRPQTVLWANYDTLADDPERLVPGLVLKILPVDGIYYRWQAGDHLEEVAGRFCAKSEDIQGFPGNHLLARGREPRSRRERCW